MGRRVALFSAVVLLAHVLSVVVDAWDVSLDRDLVARVTGRGRARSDRITITRRADDSDSLGFSPPQLDVSWVEACLPTRHTVFAENRGSASLRIDDVRLESDAFVLETDPRGVVLAPGDRLPVSFLFVVGEPQAFDSFVLFVTSLGDVALPVRGHTLPSTFGLASMRLTIPTGARVEHSIILRNPSPDRTLRVTEVFSLDGIGNVLLPANHEWTATRLPSIIEDNDATRATIVPTWELPPLATKPIARFVFHAGESTGPVRAAVRVATHHEQFLIPIDLDVRKDEFVVEPREVDLGVFTTTRERRDVLLTFHNSRSEPVTILSIGGTHMEGLEVVEVGEFPVVPPRSQVQYRLELGVRDAWVGRQRAQLEIHTNESASAMHIVQVSGFSVRGCLAYSLNQTTYRLIWPDTSYNIHDGEGIVEMGTNVSRELVLRNEFDTTLKMERASLPPTCEDFTVEGFGVGVAAPFAEFPPITLHVRPNRTGFMSTRACSLQVETNASVHHIPITLYSRHLQTSSSRNLGFQTWSCEVSSDTVQRPPQQDDFWTGVHQDPLPRIKICRKVILEMGTVASTAILDEVVNITNANPMSLHFIMHPKSEYSDSLQVEMSTSIHENPHVASELAVLGDAWERMGRETDLSGTLSEKSLAPGRTLSLRMRLKIHTMRTEVAERVATIETDFETIHVCVEFKTTGGTIAPSDRSFDLPNIHPGQLGFIEVPFKSSMAHDVVVRRVELSTVGRRALLPPVGVLQTPSIIRADSTTIVTLFYFPPAYYADCMQGSFYAECFFANATLRSNPWNKLSEFGRFVTKYDIERLELRKHEWGRHPATGQRVDVVTTLITDAMHTEPIRLAAYLTRPQFFFSSEYDQTLAFPLTEVLDGDVGYLEFINPTDHIMEIELAISKDERRLFYACDDDMTEDECVQEWQDIARERVELSKNEEQVGTGSKRAAPSDVAPLFFRPRVTRVLARERTVLGPIYFFPSRVGTWQARVFIRNTLTHIEAVTITARSGLGELSVHIPSQQAAIKDHMTQETTTGSSTNEIRFDIDDVQGANFQSMHKLVLSNSGTFEFICSVHLTDVESNAFSLSTDRGSITRDSNGSHLLDGVVLIPSEVLTVVVTFTADCFHSHISSKLEVITRNGSTQYQLIGVTSASAAFECRRRLLISDVTWHFIQQLWMVVAYFAGATIVVALWHLVVPRAKSLRLPRTEVKEEVPRSNTQARNCDDFLANDNNNRSEVSKRSPRRFDGKLVAVPPTVIAVTQCESKRESVPANREKNQPRDSGASRHRAIDDHERAEKNSPSTPQPQTSELRTVRENCKEGQPRDIGGSPRWTANDHEGTEKHRPPTQQPAKDPANDNQMDMEKANRTNESSFSQGGKQKNQPGSKEDEECEMVVVEVPESQDLNADDKSNNSVDQVQREDTASEDDEEESGSVDNQADGETDGTELSTPEEDDGDTRGQDVELLGLNFDDPFVSLSDCRLGGTDHEHPSKLPMSLDDDWNALSFEMLHSEIGKLVTDNSSTFEPRPVALHSSEPVIALPVSDGLNSLSMAPPRLPMSSLFGSNVPLPPLTLHPKKVTRPVPPGFTPADANPEASREAFDRFRHLQPLNPHATTQPLTTPEEAFPARYSLFGPALSALTAPTASDVSVGRIGSRLVSHDASNDAFIARRHPLGSPSSRLAALNGVELNGRPSPTRES